MRPAVVGLALLGIVALVWIRGRPLPARPLPEPLPAAESAEEPPEPAPAPEPEPVRRIRGTVLLPGGGPAAWAIVHAVLRGRGAEVDATAFAEADGSFALTVPRDFVEEWTRVWADHPRSGLPRNTFAFAGALPEPLVLKTSWCTISGRVVDDRGPLAYATVEVHVPRLDGRGFELLTLPSQVGADGRFSVCVQGRAGIVVLCRGPDLAAERRAVAPFDVDLSDIRLRPGVTLKGQVAGDGPLAAWVVAELSGIELRAAATGDDGAFAIPHMPGEATCRPRGPKTAR